MLKFVGKDVQFSICRSCLFELGEKEKKYNIHNPKLAYLFELFTSLKVEKDDNYPHYLCMQCFGKLKSFIEFRKICKRSFRVFKSVFLDQKSALQAQNKPDRTCEEFEKQQNKLEINDYEEQKKVLNEIYGGKDWLEFFCKNELDSLKTLENEEMEKFGGMLSLRESAKAQPKLKKIVEHTIHKTTFTKTGNLDERSRAKKQTRRKIKHANIEKDFSGIEYETDDMKSPPTSGSRYSNSSTFFVPKKIKINPKTKSFPKSLNEAPSTSSAATSFTNMKTKSKFVCKYCPRRCINQKNLDAHIRTHQGLLPFQCEKCGRSFKRAYHLRLHDETFHSDQEEFVCPHEGCGKLFNKKSTLKIHCRVKHLETFQKLHKFVCEKCGLTFMNMAALKDHCYNHIPREEYPFQCEICDKRYKSQRILKEHLLRHENIKKFECPHCGAKKTTQNELRNHINYHTKERQWPCSLCGSVFNHPGNLTLHDRVVHKGIRRFSCQYCDESFGKSDALKHHEMRHTGEKPHTCNVCGKSFIQLVALKVHLKTHNKSQEDKAVLILQKFDKNYDEPIKKVVG